MRLYKKHGRESRVINIFNSKNMDKFTVETGLNKDGIPVIKCSPAYYDELINECRDMIESHKVAGTLSLRQFVKTYPAIANLALMPTMAENFNAN